MLSPMLWTLYISAKGLKRDFRDFDSFAGLNPEDAKLDVAARLMVQIQYFGARADALPEWRDAAKIRNPLELWKHWQELPIVTRATLRKRFPASETARRFGVSGVLSSTGGSTGEPTPYFHDQGMLRSATARQLYSRIAMGWQPGMTTVSVWGSERDIGKQQSLRSKISAFLKNDRMVDGYRLGPHTANAVMHAIKQRTPVAIYGFTSMLEFVARETLKRNIRVPKGSVAVAWNGGEMLFDRQSDVFLKAFGTPILNFYGCRELSALAYQTESGGPLRVLRPHVFLEVVDKNGHSAEPGETGRLIWTSTVCRGTPFLRYEIGDLGCYGSADCDESGIGAILQLQGRDAGLQELPNGQVINCLYWNHLLKGFPEVHQFQVAVNRTGDIELRLSGEGLTADREEALRSTLRHLLCDIPVRIRWMERIPLTAQGKLVQVVKEG